MYLGDIPGEPLLPMQPYPQQRSIVEAPRVVLPLIGLALASMAFLVCAFALAFAQDHHRHHAFYQNWINLDGKGCCNNRDCGELRANDEREVSGVLQVRVEGEWCSVEPRHYLKNGNVPNASVSHACVIPQTAEPKLGPCARFICYQPQPRG